MRILVTGAKGFVGKNLCAQLNNIKDGKAKNYGLLSATETINDVNLKNHAIETVFEYDLGNTQDELDRFCQETDFVFNLAGVNRPQNPEEFMQGNFGFANTLLNTLKKHGNKAPVMLSSSSQASLAGRFGNSEYGRSKKAGEDLFLQYGEENNVEVFVYRFPNLFGKWCRPNYNSAVATFCNNIANDLPIQVNDPSVELELLYVDDLVDEMIGVLRSFSDKIGCQTGIRNENEESINRAPHRCDFNGLELIPKADGKYCYCPITHKVTLKNIVELLHDFHDQPQTLQMPEIPFNSFAKKLYSTYLSYLPKEKVAFPLKMNVDARGSFTELLKTESCGQISVNISVPGITKGQHWHNTKWEFFIVVSGHGLIQERKIGSDEIIEFEVSGEKIEAIHMLPGYTHNIINLSDTENLITVMWANESFDPNKPDTYFLPVKEKG